MPRVGMTANEFRRLFDAVSNWGRWDDGRERGALNHLTSERVTAAARLVDTGTTITLSRPLETQARPDVPQPADHRMTMVPGHDGFAKDYVGADYHNDGHTHIDAFCHVAYDGVLFDGIPASSVSDRGAHSGTIEVLKDGLVGRGVLLDVPRTRRVPWVEPGEHIFSEDLQSAERAQGVTVGPGDIVLVRTGHARRLTELEPWDTPHAKAGLHPTTASFVADRSVAALGSDGNSDTAPSTTEGVDFPIHVLALNAMGVHLLDYLELERLAEHCEAVGRWEFLFATAPLRIVGGTGSPLNPTAIF